MPKAYWIAHVDVHNPDAYKKYVEGNAVAFEKYGAKFHVRGGAFEQMEGEDIGARHVVIEFKDIETARACYNSPEYQAVLPIRLENSNGRLILVEGYE